MAKFYGKIGYAESVETKPGVWDKQITERDYSGDLIRNTRKFQNSENLNDNICIANKISIVADPFVLQNFCNMLYVEYMGVKWKISNVDVAYPRLLLTMGEVYNNKQD